MGMPLTGDSLCRLVSYRFVAVALAIKDPAPTYVGWDLQAGMRGVIPLYNVFRYISLFCYTGLLGFNSA